MTSDKPRPSLTRPPRGRPRSVESQLAVLQAAYDLTARNGLKATTIDAIARESGVSKMTVYKWWPTRLDVLIDALLQQMSQALPLKESGDPVRIMCEHAQAYARALGGELGRVQLAVIAECLSETGDTRSFVERYLAQRRALGVRVITRGQQEGVIGRRLSGADLYDRIYGTLFYRHVFALGPVTPVFARKLVTEVLQQGDQSAIATDRRSRGTK